nr:ribonuclease H-like domain-containing protein [Tanacetum cinerariifolium]
MANGSQLVHEDLGQIHEDDLEEMDLKWQLALLSMRENRYFQKTGKKITVNGSNTTGFDKSKVKCYNCHKMGHFARECRGPKNQDRRNRYQDSSRRIVHVEESPPKAMVAIDGVGFDWSYMAEHEVPTNIALMDFLDSEKNGFGFQSYNVVPPPATLVYNTERYAPQNTYLSYSGLEEFKQPEFKSNRPKSCEIESKNASEDIPNKLKEYPDTPLVNDRVSNNIDCSVESPVVVEKKTVVPTIAKVEVVRPKQHEKPVRKTLRPKAVNTARPKAVNTARPRPAVVMMSGGGANGGRITGKGTIKTDNLDSKDVYFVKELKFNLFSLLHMCDRKNNVLFTETEYLFLSLNFKLPDESQILLRVSRKNNMYSVDMKNIVPKESLTCLVAKVTLNESMLWRVEENLHIEFLENKPIVTGAGPEWYRDSISAGQSSMEIISTQEYIFMPLWKDGSPLFDSSSKISGDVVKKHDEVLDKERLQVKKKEDRIFISQDKYVAKVLRKFNYSDVKSASTPVDREKTLVKDLDGDDVDVHLYRSMIGSLMYLTASRPNIMKSTTEGCQLLGNRLISWQYKKQTVVSTSTIEAEYVAIASCCG